MEHDGNEPQTEHTEDSGPSDMEGCDDDNIPHGNEPQTEYAHGSSRPDMEGCDDHESPYVYVESKFWAGLTENQPVSYIKILARRSRRSHPTLLLVVVPESNEEAVWGQLTKKLTEEGISTEQPSYAGIVKYTKTGEGPVLALTSWTKLLSFLESTASDDPAARSDLVQLRAFCEQEEDASHPVYLEEVTNQRTPALILKLNEIVRKTRDRAIARHVLYMASSKGKERHMSGVSSDYNGIFATVLPNNRYGLWFGLDFRLWKEFGGTPLWVKFSTAVDWGRARDVRRRLENWATPKGIVTATKRDGSFVVAIDIPSGEDDDQVVSKILERFKGIQSELSKLELVGKEVIPDGR